MPHTSTTEKFEIVDIKTKLIVGTYSNRRRAVNAANRKDLEYGAVRYIVRRAA